jgi:hypothetical protein
LPLSDYAIAFAITPLLRYFRFLFATYTTPRWRRRDSSSPCAIKEAAARKRGDVTRAHARGDARCCAIVRVRADAIFFRHY